MIHDAPTHAVAPGFSHSIIPFIHMQVTTARKAMTLLLSYLIFTKPLTEQHATGLLLITMGITMKLLLDRKDHPVSVQRKKPQMAGEEVHCEKTSLV